MSSTPNATASPLVIISEDPVAVGVTVHHRDFPEIHTSGHDADAACGQLVHRLSRTLDSALTTWRRDTIERAIAEVEMFAANHA